MVLRLGPNAVDDREGELPLLWAIDRIESGGGGGKKGWIYDTRGEDKLTPYERSGSKCGEKGRRGMQRRGRLGTSLVSPHCADGAYSTGPRVPYVAYDIAAANHMCRFRLCVKRFAFVGGSKSTRI